MIKKHIVIIFIILLPFSGSCQHWQGLGMGTNWPTQCFYNDTSTNTLYVGGNFNKVDTIYSWFIAKWNGLAWDTMPKGLIGPITSIINYKGSIYAGGGSGYGIERFNGTKWEMLDTSYNFDGIVWNFYVYDDYLYVCGIFDSIANIAANGLAKWDGNTWSDVHSLPNFSPPDPLTVACMAFYQNELYVGGNFGSMHEMVKWDGNSWQTVGGGFYGGMAALVDFEVYKNKLYAAGTFSKTENSNNPGNYIAAWDGNSWSDVGSGVMGIGGSNGQIADIMVYHDELYAAGVFSYAGGVPAQYIAKWDGSNWCGLGSVFDNTLNSLGVYQDMLYIGGGFITVDGDTLNRIAKWTGGSFVDTCGNITAIQEFTNEVNELQVFPNPFSFSTTIQLSKPLQNATLSMYDILGNELKNMQNLNGNEIQITRDGLKSGMYFYNLFDEKGLVGNGKLIIE